MDKRTCDPVTRFHLRYQAAPSGCWLWTGPLKADGYAEFFYDGKRRMAHRASYELLVGPIPEGLSLDHLCRVRHCVNPEHLEPVTTRVNLMRGPGTWASINAAKTHCIHGHEFTSENTYLVAARGTRRCVTCNRISAREYQRRRRAAA